MLKVWQSKHFNNIGWKTLTGDLNIYDTWQLFRDQVERCITEYVREELDGWTIKLSNAQVAENNINMH